MPRRVGNAPPISAADAKSNSGPGEDGLRNRGGDGSSSNLAHHPHERGDEPSPRRLPQSLGAPLVSGETAAASKKDVIEFWRAQRAAMDSLKINKAFAQAIPLFETALKLNPKHEDSRYYLAQCLAAEGRAEEAVSQLEQLTRINPQSHRGFQQLGILRARTARSPADLELAQQCLERAVAINPEETGARLALGELAILRHEPARAQRLLEDVCRTNHRAVGALFLRGYLAWKASDLDAAARFLADARQALGKDWQPKGATSEGDVNRRQHIEGSLLSDYWESWDGQNNPAKAFATLESQLIAAAR